MVPWAWCGMLLLGLELPWSMNRTIPTFRQSGLFLKRQLYDDLSLPDIMLSPLVGSHVEIFKSIPTNAGTQPWQSQTDASLHFLDATAKRSGSTENHQSGVNVVISTGKCVLGGPGHAKYRNSSGQCYGFGVLDHPGLGINRHWRMRTRGPRMRPAYDGSACNIQSAPC